MSTPTITRSDQRTADAHSGPVAAGSDSGGSHETPDTLEGFAPAGSNFRLDQPNGGIHLGPVEPERTSPQANLVSSSKQELPAGDPTWNGSAATIVRPKPQPRPSLADPFLALAADVLDDTERTHIANANRLRQLTRTATDADGEDRGFGLDESHPDVARLAAMVDMLAQIEKDAAKNLTRALKAHPLAPFVKAQRGVGDKQAARLLAAIGDPYWNTLHDRPRTVSELWAYCGLHVLAGGDSSQVDVEPQHGNAGVAARRQKGQRSNWSTIAKTRAWLVIESCMKQLDATCKTDTGIADHVEGCGCSPYRVVIDKRRAHTLTTHPDWTAGHGLNDGMRIASKALLRDLWREAKRIHEGDPS